MSTHKHAISVEIGILLFTIGCGLLIIFVGLVVWGSFTAIVASFPATADPDCAHTPGCNRILLASTTQFHTGEVRLKQWKGGNLSIYVDRHKFEAIPFPDRDRLLTPIVEDWCQSYGGPLLPSIWFADLRTGSALKRSNCFGIWFSHTWDNAFVKHKRVSRRCVYCGETVAIVSSQPRD
jgi:hypothetical protein